MVNVPFFVANRYRQKCVGNALMITEGTYNKALSRVNDAEKSISESSQDEDLEVVSGIFRNIEEDCSTIFKSLKIFQPGGPLYDDLLIVTKAYSFYRSGFGHIPGAHAVAATFLVNLSPFNTFVMLANLLNRPLPLAFLANDQMAVSSLLISLIRETYILHSIRLPILPQSRNATCAFHQCPTTPSIVLPRQSIPIIIRNAYAP
jgi:hypothetical protein